MVVLLSIVIGKTSHSHGQDNVGVVIVIVVSHG